MTIRISQHRMDLDGADLRNANIVNSTWEHAPSMFRNRIINGNFDIWQRGTSLSAATGVRFLADRWKTQGAGSTCAPSRQSFTLGQTDVPGEPRYFHRVVVASSAGAGNLARLQQFLEGVRSLAGQTATVSFYAKADAAKNIAVEFSQSFGSGGSPSAFVSAIGVTTVGLGTTWAKYTVSVTVPSIAGKVIGTDDNDWLALSFWLDAGSDFNARTNSLGQQSGTFDIAQVQLEPGSIATTFEFRPIGVELGLCRRYCRPIGLGLIGDAYTTTNVGVVAVLSPEMFSLPAAILVDGTNALTVLGTSTHTVTGINSITGTGREVRLLMTFTAALGAAPRMMVGSANDFILLTAEL